MKRLSSTIGLVLILAIVYWSAASLLGILVLPDSGWLDHLLGLAGPMHFYSRLTTICLLIITGLILHIRFLRHLKTSTQWGSHFHELYEHAALGLYRTSIETGRILECNEATARVFGYADRETLLRDYRAENHYLNMEDRAKLLESLTNGSMMARHDVKMKKLDGTDFWARTAAKVYPDEGFLEGTVFDVTREKEAHARLYASEQALRAIIDNSPVGISVRSNAGQLISYNKAWRNIWGMSKDEADADLLRERNQVELDERDKYLGSHAEDVLRVYREGGTAYLPEYRTNPKRPGSALWISQRFYAITDESGAVDRVVILTEDVTAQKLALEEREQLISELQQALADVRELSGLLPICSNCKKIRDDKGYWQQIEGYISSHTAAEFTHGICPVCAEELYGDQD